MKKIIAIVLVGLLLLGMMACGKDVEEPVGTETGTDTSAPADSTPAPTPGEDDGEEDNGNDQNDSQNGTQSGDKDGSVSLNKNTKGIKLLGTRGILSDTQINCDWAGSGIEFVLDNRSATVMIEATSSAACRFKVFVNGEIFKTLSNQEFHEINRSGVIVLQGLPSETLTIRVVKVTDHTLATAQLLRMTFSGEIKSDSTPANKDLYIEFVGGSEMVGTFAEGGTYATQDVTQAYSYLLARKMNADYSIVSFDGDTALTKTADVAALYAKASPSRDANATHDFARKADVVVVDLGSVDAVLSATDNTVTAVAFAEKYEALLTAIRQKNGEDCKIIGVFTDAMGEFGTAVQTVCNTELGGQQEGIYLCRRTVGANGIVNAGDSIAFAETLKAVVELAVTGATTDRELKTEATGEGMQVSFKEDFVPLSE